MSFPGSPLGPSPDFSPGSTFSGCIGQDYGSSRASSPASSLASESLDDTSALLGANEDTSDSDDHEEVKELIEKEVVEFTLQVCEDRMKGLMRHLITHVLTKAVKQQLNLKGAARQQAEVTHSRGKHMMSPMVPQQFLFSSDSPSAVTPPASPAMYSVEEYLAHVWQLVVDLLMNYFEDRAAGIDPDSEVCNGV